MPRSAAAPGMRRAPLLLLLPCFSATEPPLPFLGRCQRALDALGRYLPGLLSLQLLGAQCAFLTGDLSAAQRKVNDVLFRSPKLPEAHFLLAKVALQQGQPSAAIRGLEHAMGQDLSIKDTPQFLTLTARALLALGKVRLGALRPDAGENKPRQPQPHWLTMGTAVMASPSPCLAQVKDAVTVAEQAGRARGIRPPKPGAPPVPEAALIPLVDRCSAYITLAEAYDAGGKQGEAGIVLEEAAKEFVG